MWGQQHPQAVNEVSGFLREEASFSVLTCSYRALLIEYVNGSGAAAGYPSSCRHERLGRVPPYRRP